MTEEGKWNGMLAEFQTKGSMVFATYLEPFMVSEVNERRLIFKNEKEKIDILKKVIR